jgi:hypothetical protein
MIHLKSYKLFESSVNEARTYINTPFEDEIKTNLQDMLVDLSDNGIEVEINQFQLTNPSKKGPNGHNVTDNIFSVRIGKYNDLMRQMRNYNKTDITDYKDDFIRLVHYMESEDFGFLSLAYYDPNGISINYTKSSKQNPDKSTGFFTLTHGRTTYTQNLISKLFDIKETNNLKMYFIKI